MAPRRPSGRTDPRVLAVEVKERTLTLTDVEGTLRKGRQRKIKDIFFATPGVRDDEKTALEERIAQAFAGGQNLYVFDFFDFSRSVLALGGRTDTDYVCSKSG